MHRAQGVGLLWLLTAVTPAVGQAAITGIVLTERPGAIDAVVYLVPTNGLVRAPADAGSMIDQVGLRYRPTVSAVLPGTTIEFKNSDALLHNVFSPAGPGAGFDLGTFSSRETRQYTFDEIGTHIILCHVHPEMYAYVLVVPTPYVAVAEDTGRFRIEDVPAGRYTVRVWHRRDQGFERELVVEPNGNVELTIDLMSRR